MSNKYKCVYAGPEYFARKAKENEAENRPEPDPEPIECVYAGPEFFEPDHVEEIKEEPAPEATAEPEKTEEEKPDPKKPPKFDPKDLSQFAGVYAGPDQMRGFQPDERQYMMAYAGPANLNQGIGLGMFVNMNGMMNAPAAPKKKCPACGEEAEPADKFCAKCGARFPDKKFCPGCGHQNGAGAKFCVECGAKLDV